MKIKIQPSPYNDKFNYTHQVGEVVFKCGTTIEAKFVDGRQNIFVLGNDCYIIEGFDDDIDILSKPIGLWGCSSDISTIWDKLSELERECDNHIKQQKEEYPNAIIQNNL